MYSRSKTKSHCDHQNCYSQHALHIISTLDYKKPDTNSLYNIITIKIFAVVQSLQHSIVLQTQTHKNNLVSPHTLRITHAYISASNASSTHQHIVLLPIPKFADDLQPCRSAKIQLQVGTFMYRPGVISHSTMIAPLTWSQLAFICLHKMKGASSTDRVFAGAIRRSWGTFCHVCWARSLCQEGPQPTRPNHAFMLRQQGRTDNVTAKHCNKPAVQDISLKTSAKSLPDCTKPLL